MKKKLIEITKKLDQEFNIASNHENLVEWAVTDENRKYIDDYFLARKTGLMTRSSTLIKKVFTTVFITDNIVNEISKNAECLIITHHHFNYFEDERGLQPIRPEVFKNLSETKNSIYVAHAPLDTHKKYGTSISLAELCDIEIDELFFEYFGAPTALFGHVDREKFEDCSEKFRRKVQRPYLKLVKNNNYIEKIAVIAGGGDMPEILQQAYDFGCDTLFTGTVEHRWNVPFIQDGNRKFHELNKKLKLNLIGGTHFATERQAMIKFIEIIKDFDIDCDYLEDKKLLNSE